MPHETTPMNDETNKSSDSSDAANRSEAPIFHLTPASAFREGVEAGSYVPAAFAEDGFVHCTATAELTLRVAADYFANCGEPLLALEIDPQRLHSPLRYEAPAPIPGGGRSHLENGVLFPHIYGPIKLDAIVGVGVLDQRGGEFAWPRHFGPLPAPLR
jgi:uncharacterized protein (DUF952 family)